jgi:putative flippase GtrA
MDLSSKVKIKDWNFIVLIQALSFGASGFVSTGINIFVTAFFYEIVCLPVEIAYAIGLASATVTNFFLCRDAIFRSSKKFKLQFPIFILSSLLFRGIEYLAFLVIENNTNFPYVVVIFAIHFFSTLIKFLYYKTFLFK